METRRIKYVYLVFYKNKKIKAFTSKSKAKNYCYKKIVENINSLNYSDEMKEKLIAQEKYCLKRYRHCSWSEINLIKVTLDDEEDKL